MTLSNILALSSDTSPRIIFATDTQSYYIIRAGQPGSTADKLLLEGDIPEGAGIINSPDEPPAPTDGMGWFDTSSSILYFWSDTMDAWVSVIATGGGQSPEALTLDTGDPNTIPTTITIGGGPFTTSVGVSYVFPPLLATGGLLNSRPVYTSNGLNNGYTATCYYASNELGWVLETVTPMRAWNVAANNMSIYPWGAGSLEPTGQNSGIAVINAEVAVGTFIGQRCRVGTDPYTWWRWNGTLWEREDRRVIVTTPPGNYVIQVPDGTPTIGDQVLIYVTPSGAGTLSAVEEIKIPGWYGLELSKAMNTNELYIVGLNYTGTFWALTTVVGGYI